MEILLLLVNGNHAWITLRQGQNPEDEIAEWCRVHNINEDNVADYVVREVIA